MSVAIMAQVWATDLPANEKIVLLAYADHANDDGTSIYPGEQRMALKTSYSAGNVRRITSDLIDDGTLIRVARGHRGQRAIYRIDLRRLADHRHPDELSTPEPIGAQDARLSTGEKGAQIEPKGAQVGGERRASRAVKARGGATPNHQEPSGTIRTINPAQTPNSGSDGSAAIVDKSTNHGWDLLTDMDGPFALPAGTAGQRRRVGKLSADINATMDHHQIPDTERRFRLLAAAASWPAHFESATLTPDAFAKHLPALLRQPLRATPEQAEQAARRLDRERAISEAETHQRRKAIT